MNARPDAAAYEEHRVVYDDESEMVMRQGLRIGEAVYHPSYYKGKVLSLNGVGPSRRAQVRFRLRWLSEDYYVHAFTALIGLALRA